MLFKECFKDPDQAFQLMVPGYGDIAIKEDKEEEYYVALFEQYKPKDQQLGYNVKFQVFDSIDRRR